MKIYSIYFSPTGGTRKVADVVMEAFDGEKEEIDISRPEADYGAYRFEREDLCLVSVPSFGGRVPGAALERLAAMGGGGARAVMAAVFGNRAIDDTLLELEDTLVGAGFLPVAAMEANAQHSIMGQFGQGRPDPEDVRELREFGARIREKLSEEGREEPVRVPGKRPYKAYNGVPFKPEAGRDCTACGLCAEKCPVGAIPRENPRGIRREVCISCMRCVALCPMKARGLNKAALFAASQKMKKALGGRKENRLYL